MKDVNRKRIRYLMAITHTSERKLASLSGLSRSSINHKLNGYRDEKFNASDVKKIADALNVRPEFLYGDPL